MLTKEKNRSCRHNFFNFIRNIKIIIVIGRLYWYVCNIILVLIKYNSTISDKQIKQSYNKCVRNFQVTWRYKVLRLIVRNRERNLYCFAVTCLIPRILFISYTVFDVLKFLKNFYRNSHVMKYKRDKR